MYRYLVTKQQILGKQVIVSSLYDENRHMIDLALEPVTQVSLLGNIYVARVKNVVKNLDAAFVRIDANQTCYLSLKELKHPIYVKKQSKTKDLCEGDEIVVQVCKEALKTKDPGVTTNLNFPGKYVVLTTGNRKLGISSKLDAAERKRFQNLFEGKPEKGYGFIVRTNAKDVTDEEVLLEADSLIQKYEKLKETAIHRTAYSCLYEEEAPYLKQLSSLYLDSVEKIVTDEKELYLQMKAYQEQHQNQIPLEFYEDDAISLSALYGMRSAIDEALGERVWLKSGAYLVIQPTEALTVIDVNSGKNVAKKDKWENFKKINIEAAREIAHQLRIRNISGMIVVDFIKLKSKEDDFELLEHFRTFLKSDPVPTDVWDMTKLGLVEVTRKKVRKSLAEALRGE